jgi:hypothetical protein
MAVKAYGNPMVLATTDELVITTEQRWNREQK